MRFLKTYRLFEELSDETYANTAIGFKKLGYEDRALEITKHRFRKIYSDHLEKLKNTPKFDIYNSAFKQISNIYSNEYYIDIKWIEMERIAYLSGYRINISLIPINEDIYHDYIEMLKTFPIVNMRINIDLEYNRLKRIKLRKKNIKKTTIHTEFDTINDSLRRFVHYMEDIQSGKIKHPGFEPDDKYFHEINFSNLFGL